MQQRRKLGETALKAATDGRVFSGRQAVKLNLVDAIGGERAARKWLEAKHNIADDLTTRNVHWGDKAGLIARALDTIGGKLFKNKRLTLDGLLSVWQP